MVFTPTTASHTGLTRETHSAPTGRFVTRDGETYSLIDGVDTLAPFLVALASETDLWMYVSSRGGLTAGRRDAHGAFFPYETADKLHDAHHHTGPLTLIRVLHDDGHVTLWEPFAPPREDDAVERRLAKNLLGNRVIVEEERADLGLTIRARWAACDAFGWVRTVTIENHGARAVSLEVLDGLRNLLPHGAPLGLYQTASVLVDAYKRVDVDPATQLAVVALTAEIVDRAEPAEALRATTVWTSWRDAAEVALDGDAPARFRRGDALAQGATCSTGRRAHYFARAALTLAAGEASRWHLAADTARSHADVAALRRALLDTPGIAAAVDAALDEASEALWRTVASADGVQTGGDTATTAHHTANVLFNNMRGGVFDRHHVIARDDLRRFFHERHRGIAARHAAWLDALPESLDAAALREAARTTGDPQCERLVLSYLPLYFGRRHGDPSRPWNRFDIRVRHADGSRALHFEGNWRDIFQNWEALAASFPRFLPHMIATFLSASTVDGFNPYRLTRDGIDWEVADPHDPWSHIGYWGDHQIVYLLRFLEALEHAAPGDLDAAWGRALYAFADVPYRLKPYAAIVADPHHTIDYDDAAAERAAARVAACGGDGRFLPGPAGEPHLATLAEKLLLPALAKLSNLVPDGGIWMNTQRPEWNDANNALAGYGVSVVTLCHLRRYLRLLAELAARRGGEVEVAASVVLWMRRLHAAFAEYLPALTAARVDDATRRQLLDACGLAFEEYRAAAYAGGPRTAEALASADIAAFCDTALAHVEHAIRANRRDDGLYHSYNLLELRPGAASLSYLDEMLEGQVAALSSGLVGAAEAVHVVWQMYGGRLYRADQDSFLLYPEKDVPPFFERNLAPRDAADAIALVRELVAAGDASVIVRDVEGHYRFAPALRNAAALDAALSALAEDPRWAAAIARDGDALRALYEATFHHRAFTGRSGTMYAYEGLGSIYWHMVSKLLLAVQEVLWRAIDEGEPPAVVAELTRAYYRIRGGLGFAKTPAAYGAFPTDPYSHTPRHAGAQQPGMTGQVKEEILTRAGELGVRVREGRVSFAPRFLRRDEWTRDTATWRGFSHAGAPSALEVPPGALAFSVCQTPVLYHGDAADAAIRVTFADGSVRDLDGATLDEAYSAALLSRDGVIARLDVHVPASGVLDT